jgi:glutamate-1-semialdehyde 2,1-aminomutase
MAVVTPPTYGNRFLESDSESARLAARARSFLPGGNSRTTVFSPPYPFYVRSGQGAYLTDVEGQVRLDFLNNYTSLLHGHAHQEVVQAATRQVELGSSFAAPTELEVALAEEICARAPAIERIRFTNSGTEAVMMAIKAARGFTGRSMIAKFEGCYHGTYDPAEISVSPELDLAGPADAPRSVPESAGLPAGTADDVLVLPFNDQDAVERLVGQHADRLAAIVVDPLPHQAGFPAPLPGFLPFLRELTDQHGIVLISDEIISFRIAYDGAHGHLGFRPHLVTLGKIIGGGFPVGALGGSAEVMSVFDPTAGHPRVPHGGTFNANPVTMAAGLAALRRWDRREVERLNHLGAELRRRADQILVEAEFPAQISGDGSLFKLVPGREQLLNYRSVPVDRASQNRLAELQLRLLGSGIIVGSKGTGCLSTPMGRSEVDTFVDTLERAIREMRIS